MKKWKIKNERPEEVYKNPEIFYTKEESSRYNTSSGMAKVQQKIANRIVQLLDLKNGHNLTLLDVGCGTGNTLTAFESFGFNVFGADISKEMLKFAKEKGYKKMVLSTYPIMKNANRFYKRNGFREFEAKPIEQIHVIKEL